jgi:hypothetical protein
MPIKIALNMEQHKFTWDLELKQFLKLLCFSFRQSFSILNLRGMAHTAQTGLKVILFQ